MNRIQFKQHRSEWNVWWRTGLWLAWLPVVAAAEILRVDYSGGFTVWPDCAQRGAVKFQYNAQRDTGDAKH